MGNFSFLSLLPPIIAIVLCITTKQLIISLFIGAFSGAMVLCGYNPVSAFVTTLSYIVKSVANDWNASVLVFTMVLGGFIGLLGRSGAMQGLVNVVIHSVNTRIRGQLAACLLSVMLFFDDYTSIILSGVVIGRLPTVCAFRARSLATSWIVVVPVSRPRHQFLTGRPMKSA